MSDPAKLARVIEALTGLWDSQSRVRGEEYFRARRVDVKRVEAGCARSVVRGTMGNYASNFERERGDTWACSCTCPAFARGIRCKHLWAFALTLDSLGWRFEGLHEGSLREARLVQPSPWRARLADIRARSEELVRPTPQREMRVDYVLRVDLSVVDDQIVVETRKSTRRKSGAWGKPLPFAPLAYSNEGDLTEHDRRIVAILRGGTDSWRTASNKQFVVDEAQVDLILPLMAQRDALRWADIDRESPGPVRLELGEPWRLRRKLREDTQSGEVVIEGEWRCGDRVESFANTIALLPGGLVVFPERIARVARPAEAAWARSLEEHGPLRVPIADKSELLRELDPTADGVELDGAFASARRDIVPRPRLRLDAPILNDNAWSDLSGEAEFDYDGVQVAAHDARPFIERKSEWIARHLDAERTLSQRPLELGARPSSSRPGAFSVPLACVAELVRTLTAEGWQVEGEGARYRVSGATSWSLTSNLDWFELAGTVDFEGSSASVPKLIAALRRGEHTLVLGDGTIGVLPENWLARHGALVTLGTTRGGVVRFKSAQAWLLDALLAGQDKVDVDQRFREQIARLAQFRGITPATEPPGFRGELRPYQREGLGWLEFLEQQRLGGCLADDMGLGKTVQVLAWLVARRARRAEHAPTLVVAPRSLTHNWLSEAHRFAPELSTLDYTGTGRKGSLEELARRDLVVTTYGTMRNDIEGLSDQRFDCVVLDESQAIKNENSLTAKAVRLLQAEHRFALSGTPIENHLGELWSLFEFLNPGMLGRSSVFADFVAAPRDRALGDEARTLLAKAVRPFVLRRTKEQVLRDLPQKTEQIVSCELGAAARREYDELRDYYRRKLLDDGGDQELDSFCVLEALLRLRQAACHPGLMDRQRVDESSAKLDNLLAMVDEVVGAGHKALIFSQFTSFLAIVRARVEQRGLVHAYLDGQTPARTRVSEIQRFQQDRDCPLFLLSLKAGGVGLNLTAADYVFLLDPWWNPAVEAQAIGRAHRIGQTRSVFAYKLVAAGTIEERVLELQARKRELAAVLLDGEATTLRDLTREDLEQLLQ